MRVFVDPANDFVIEHMQFCFTCVGKTGLVAFPANCTISQHFLFGLDVVLEHNFLPPLLFDVTHSIFANEDEKDEKCRLGCL